MRELELRMQRRGRVPFDAVVRAATRGGDGAASYGFLIRDVSEQKLTERALWELNAELERRVRERAEELARQTALLETVLDQLPVGVTVVDAAGAVIRRNRYLEQLVELPSEGLPLEAAAGLLRRPGGGEYEQDRAPLRRALAGEQVQDERVELPRGGREPLVVAVDASPVHGADGEVVAAVAVVADVSERERIRRAEREFTVNAAHELRTPLAAIVGAVEALQAGAKDVPEERDLFLGHLERECRRLARIVRALLLIARSQTRSERPRLEVVSLRPLLREAASGVRPAAAVSVSVRCRRDLAALTNRDLLEQAVLNLLANAARYTAEGSIVLQARAEGEQAVVEIADTGVGVPLDVRERLAVRFAGGEGGGERFGLGLSIALQAVEASGGALELAPAARGGTVARIRLPLARLVRP